MEFAVFMLVTCDYHFSSLEHIIKESHIDYVILGIDLESGHCVLECGHYEAFYSRCMDRTSMTHMLPIRSVPCVRQGPYLGYCLETGAQSLSIALSLHLGG